MWRGQLARSGGDVANADCQCLIAVAIMAITNSAKPTTTAIPTHAGA